MTGEMERENWRVFQCSRLYRVNNHILIRYNSKFSFSSVFQVGWRLLEAE
jgi:hypothetical protein